MRKILIVNGPNLNLLGKREPEVYGAQSLSQINEHLTKMAAEMKLQLEFFQSNHEGEIIDFIHKLAPEADGLIINPGALTHYSYALRDAIAGVDIETVEVHMSNVYARDEFRHHSVIAPIVRGHVVGLGAYSYAMALSYFADATKG
jgi:3-dehydroquinate dehydratase-2